MLVVIIGAGAIGYLNGEIDSLGRRYAIETPVNDLLQRRVNKLVGRGGAPGSISIAELRDELSGET